jgi:hypothetical protein
MSVNVKYGFGNTVKYNVPKLDVKSSTSTNTIISSRVRDIILDDTHIRFLEFGGWNGIGTIFIEPTVQPNRKDNIPLIPAYPAFPNIKQYPLLNELVPVLYLADPNITENTSAVSAYYLPPINAWNSQVHNAVPSSDVTPELENKEYPLVEAGSIRRITDQDTDITLGKTFTESDVLDTYPLLPYEGDIIYEGRFGNSIRFGSTVKSIDYPNPWSEVGKDGSPITIIKNGQGDGSKNISFFEDEQKNPWIPTLENINIDKSSIYLTANQQIPLILSNNTADSYGADINNVPNVQNYLGDQILLNSGQLVFNSKKDDIILSSNKSIHLSANTTLNFDAINQITLASPKVYLGSSFGSEGIQLQSAVLGEKLTQALLTFVQAVEATAEAMTTNVAVIGPVATLTAAGPILKSACVSLKNTLNSKDILSNQVYINQGSKK